MVRLSINVARLRLWALLAPYQIIQSVAELALAKCQELGIEEVLPFGPLAKGEVQDPGMDTTTVRDWIARNDFTHESEGDALIALQGLAAIAPKAPVPQVESAPPEEQAPVDDNSEPAGETTDGEGSDDGDGEEGGEEGSEESESENGGEESTEVEGDDAAD